MPNWIGAVGLAYVLCLASASGLCQAPPASHEQAGPQSVPVHRPVLVNGVPTGDAHQVDPRNPPRPLAVVRAVDPIQKTEPEYTDEARLAELEGAVVLTGSIDAEGFAQDLKVAEPLGLGLDEKAVEAVQQWHFAPDVYPGVVQISVQFQLPSKRSRWHLIAAQFDAPPGVSRPIFASAEYPIGAGIGPEAMEEGRVLVAIGRLATAKLKFDIDEHGVPANFQIQSTSDDVWGPEATALVGQWRFMPGTKKGIPVRVPCTVDLVWGTRELTPGLERQLHDVLTPRQR